jgi:hypothetical protein
MNRFAALLLGLLVAAVLPTVAQDTEGPAAFEFIVGPRLGMSYVLVTPSEFTAKVVELYPGGEYFPLYTLFGITFEQRILLGNTRSHFAFQELVLVGGLEQAVALPMGAVLIGYRDWAGFEIGMGPILNFSGVGVVAAIGWTLSFNGVYVPIDVSVVLPSRQKPTVVSLTTGFNFMVRRRELKTF